MVVWKRQEIILLFHTVCINPPDSLLLNDDNFLPIITEFAELLQKPELVVYEKIQHLLYLKTKGKYGKWSGGTKIDREIFEEFNDDAERLTFVAERIRYELKNPSLYFENLIDDFLEAEVKEIERLKKEGWSTDGVGNISPAVRHYNIKYHDRLPTITAIAKLRANFRCEIKGCKYEPFTGVYNLPYIEVHHIERLADGGQDTLENTVCLCPAHHREIHFGSNKNKLNYEVLEKRGKV
jgi:hypothetical protein